MNKIIVLPGLLTAILSLSACTSMGETDQVIALWGDPVSPSLATRTIVIGPGTRFVNVEGGEVVKFVAGDQTFAWAFAPQGGSDFELNRIAPAGALDHRVMAYVSTPERYLPNW